MELNIENNISVSNPKNNYRVTVNTMVGDANGDNSFDVDFEYEDYEEVVVFVRYCEILNRQYPNGRGGGTGFYDELDFFEELFDEEWHYEEGEWMDSMSGYTVAYFDREGSEFKVEVVLDDEDNEIIESYGVLK